MMLSGLRERKRRSVSGCQKSQIPTGTRSRIHNRGTPLRHEPCRRARREGAFRDRYRSRDVERGRIPSEARVLPSQVKRTTVRAKAERRRHSTCSPVCRKVRKPARERRTRGPRFPRRSYHQHAASPSSAGTTRSPSATRETARVARRQATLSRCDGPLVPASRHAQRLAESPECYHSC